MFSHVSIDVNIWSLQILKRQEPMTCLTSQHHTELGALPRPGALRP